MFQPSFTAVLASLALLSRFNPAVCVAAAAPAGETPLEKPRYYFPRHVKRIVTNATIPVVPTTTETSSTDSSTTSLGAGEVEHLVTSLFTTSSLLPNGAEITRVIALVRPSESAPTVAGDEGDSEVDLEDSPDDDEPSGNPTILSSPTSSNLASTNTTSSAVSSSTSPAPASTTNSDKDTPTTTSGFASTTEAAQLTPPMTTPPPTTSAAGSSDARQDGTTSSPHSTNDESSQIYQPAGSTPEKSSITSFGNTGASEATTTQFQNDHSSATGKADSSQTTSGAREPNPSDGPGPGPAQSIHDSDSPESGGSKTTSSNIAQPNPSEQAGRTAETTTAGSSEQTDPNDSGPSGLGISIGVSLPTITSDTVGPGETAPLGSGIGGPLVSGNAGASETAQGAPGSEETQPTNSAGSGEAAPPENTGESGGNLPASTGGLGENPSAGIGGSGGILPASTGGLEGNPPVSTGGSGGNPPANTGGSGGNPPASTGGSGGSGGSGEPQPTGPLSPAQTSETGQSEGGQGPLPSIPIPEPSGSIPPIVEPVPVTTSPVIISNAHTTFTSEEVVPLPTNIVPQPQNTQTDENGPSVEVPITVSNDQATFTTTVPVAVPDQPTIVPSQEAGNTGPVISVPVTISNDQFTITTDIPIPNPANPTNPPLSAGNTIPADGGSGDGGEEPVASTGAPIPIVPAQTPILSATITAGNDQSPLNSGSPAEVPSSGGVPPVIILPTSIPDLGGSNPTAVASGGGNNGDVPLSSGGVPPVIILPTSIPDLGGSNPTAVASGGGNNGDLPFASVQPSITGSLPENPVSSKPIVFGPGGVVSSLGVANTNVGDQGPLPTGGAGPATTGLGGQGVSFPSGVLSGGSGSQATQPAGISDSGTNGNPSGFPGSQGQSQPTGGASGGASGASGNTALGGASGTGPSGSYPTGGAAASNSGASLGGAGASQTAGSGASESGEGASPGATQSGTSGSGNTSGSESGESAGNTNSVAQATAPPATVSYGATAGAPQTIEPVGSNSLTALPVPTSIVHAPEASSGPSQTSAFVPVVLPSSVPAMVQPPGGIPSQPDNTTRIQVGFLKPLNYGFVVSNPVTQQQIFGFLPPGIAYGLGIDEGDVTIELLKADETSTDLPYIRTLALAFIPKDQVNNLYLDLHTPTQRIYHNPNASISMLMNFIDPSVAIQADNPMAGPGGPGFDGSPSATPSNTADSGAPIGGGINNDAPVRPSSVAVSVGVICGAAAYGAAMFFIARRYRMRRQSHGRSPSMFSSPVYSGSQHDFMGGANAALMSGARGDGGGRSTSPLDAYGYGRDSRGSGRSGGSSGRQQISAPVMAENSLGWN
ncbi:MAG: hypothetical protein LQ351_005428 [Letrouitia transgressa]|nr:MAG: hypothetical protein LQ351_005428 [Letrouitia transgressa]